MDLQLKEYGNRNEIKNIIEIPKDNTLDRINVINT